MVERPQRCYIRKSRRSRSQHIKLATLFAAVRWEKRNDNWKITKTKTSPSSSTTSKCLPSVSTPPHCDPSSCSTLVHHAVIAVVPPPFTPPPSPTGALGQFQPCPALRPVYGGAIRQGSHAVKYTLQALRMPNASRPTCQRTTERGWGERGGGGHHRVTTTAMCLPLA